MRISDWISDVCSADHFHEGVLPWIGGIAVLGMLLLLALFFFFSGRIRAQGPESGVMIQRFNVVERFTHWMTATAFIVLAITGQNGRASGWERVRQYG